MKIFKKIMIVGALLVTSMTYAQTSEAEIQEAAKSKTNEMVLNLDLTEEQEVLIYRQLYVLGLHQRSFDKLETKSTKEKETMKKYKEECDKNILKTLNDEQKTKYQKDFQKKVLK